MHSLIEEDMLPTAVPPATPPTPLTPPPVSLSGRKSSKKISLAFLSFFLS
jgi:hypothetical protein